MSHLKKTLQIWKAGYVNEDHSQTVEKWSKLADRFCRMAKRRRDLCHGRESHVKKNAAKEIFKVAIKKDDKHQH